MQDEGIVLAVPFAVAVFNPDGVGASHVPARQLAGGNTLAVVVHSARGSRNDIRPGARVVIEPSYLDSVLLQLNKVAAVYLDLVAAPPMYETDDKLQFPSAIVCGLDIPQPEFAAIAADVRAGVYIYRCGRWRDRRIGRVRRIGRIGCAGGVRRVGGLRRADGGRSRTAAFCGRRYVRGSGAVGVLGVEGADGVEPFGAGLQFGVAVAGGGQGVVEELPFVVIGP